MREIKFRAWDGARGTMTPSATLEEWVDCMSTACPQVLIKGFFSDHIFMQYTGLKDKNGVEIYEGDIIEYPAWIRPKNSHKQTRATVVWLVDGYAGKIRGEWAAHSITGDWQKSKVIGNIWENKE